MLTDLFPSSLHTDKVISLAIIIRASDSPCVMYGIQNMSVFYCVRTSNIINHTSDISMALVAPAVMGKAHAL